MKITKHEINGDIAVTAENNRGMSVTFCSRGAGIVSIKVPDRDGVMREVTKPHAAGYGNGHNGLTTGRTAGRIENARFTIDGITAELEKNNHGVDNLHGGKDALHRKLFDMRIIEKQDGADIVFSYFSPDGEGGYFGNAKITVTYSVREDENIFTLIFDVMPDCKTLFDLTNHVYLDASGDLRESVLEQEMYVNASRVGKLGERSITKSTVAVSPQFDFRTPHKIGEHITDGSVQSYAGGYDHPFFLDHRGLDKIACALYSRLSGIKISVATTYPCAVIYTDNADNNKSVCFECQYHPDGIHACPDDCGICSPDKPYHEATLYKFSIE